MLGNNGHTRCAYTAPHGLIRFITSPWLHAFQYIALTCMHVDVQRTKVSDFNSLDAMLVHYMHAYMHIRTTVMNST